MNADGGAVMETIMVRAGRKVQGQYWSRPERIKGVQIRRTGALNLGQLPSNTDRTRPPGALACFDPGGYVGDRTATKPESRYCLRQVTQERDMPRYYFDVQDGERQCRDDLGDEFPDLTAAETEAISTAVELARESLRTARELRTTIRVRDESEKPLVRVHVDAKVTVEPIK
jgi:hypothetical protein